MIETTIFNENQELSKSHDTPKNTLEKVDDSERQMLIINDTYNETGKAEVVRHTCSVGTRTIILNHLWWVKLHSPIYLDQ